MVRVVAAREPGGHQESRGGSRSKRTWVLQSFGVALLFIVFVVVGLGVAGAVAALALRAEPWVSMVWALVLAVCGGAGYIGASRSDWGYPLGCLAIFLAVIAASTVLISSGRQKTSVAERRDPEHVRLS